jgi:hypothetical protein
MRKLICAIALGLAAPAAAQPGAAGPPDDGSRPYPPPPPPPSHHPLPAGATHATFVSTGEGRWDVRIDNNAVCTTPCALVIDPMRYVTLHSQDRAPIRIAVGHLPPGEILVQARPRANAAFATGVTFTSLSGMGLATGITLTAVGCSTDRGGMCTAGLITGGVSAVGLYLSIDLLRRSLPRLHVGPARPVPYVAGNTVGLAGRF